MAQYRNALPQMSGELLLTDAGLETVLVFIDGLDLPCFAAFDLLKTDNGRARLKSYYGDFAGLAKEHDRGFLFESPTWRANPDWGKELGYDEQSLAAANKDAIALMREVRDEANASKPMVISGCIGPRGDGYDPGALMSVEEAENYHHFQAKNFADTDADLITAVTMTNSPEAIGVANAGAKVGMPVAISFTVETDGRLPSGQPLHEAIAEVDQKASTRPAYFMVNCAHPTHFMDKLEKGGAWLDRIKGVRANASKCSHAELDEAEVLDDGDPGAFGKENAQLKSLVPGLTIFGGCCGTDRRHVEQIAKAIGN